MIIEIVPAREVEAREAAGWERTGREFCVINGKARTVEMQKDGDPMAWIEADNKIKADAVAKMSRAERRIYFKQVTLYARGLGV
jgi:hypothetical protein